MRDYFDNRWHGITLGLDDFVGSPTGIANFKSQSSRGRSTARVAERVYNVERWTPMERGGHFAPIEEPVAVARDIAAFFARLI